MASQNLPLPLRHGKVLDMATDWQNPLTSFRRDHLSLSAFHYQDETLEICAINPHQPSKGWTATVPFSTLNVSQLNEAMFDDNRLILVGETLHIFHDAVSVTDMSVSTTPKKTVIPLVKMEPIDALDVFVVMTSSRVEQVEELNVMDRITSQQPLEFRSSNRSSSSDVDNYHECKRKRLEPFEPFVRSLTKNDIGQKIMKIFPIVYERFGGKDCSYLGEVATLLDVAQSGIVFVEDEDPTFSPCVLTGSKCNGFVVLVEVPDAIIRDDKINMKCEYLIRVSVCHENFQGRVYFWTRNRLSTLSAQSR